MNCRLFLLVFFACCFSLYSRMALNMEVRKQYEEAKEGVFSNTVLTAYLASSDKMSTEVSNEIYNKAQSVFIQWYLSSEYNYSLSNTVSSVINENFLSLFESGKIIYENKSRKLGFYLYRVDIENLSNVISLIQRRALDLEGEGRIAKNRFRVVVTVINESDNTNGYNEKALEEEAIRKISFMLMGEYSGLIEENVIDTEQFVDAVETEIEKGNLVLSRKAINSPDGFRTCEGVYEISASNLDKAVKDIILSITGNL